MCPNILFSTLFSELRQSVFFLECERPSFTPLQDNRHNYGYDNLIFRFIDRGHEDKRF
jgi:hypothetical protein